MNYSIIDNFISKESCQRLIICLENLLKNNSETILYHGNRSEIFSTYSSFQKMLEVNDDLKDLNNYFFSQDFFNLLCDKLSINSLEYDLIKYYNLNKFNYLNINRKNISQLHDNEIIKIFFHRKLRQIISKLKFNNWFNKKKYVELLYGLSRAGNGYKQDVHRDSDSRLIVFLLYLNDSPKNSFGGNLNIFKKNKSINNIENPNLESLDKIKSISPKAGRLVIFKNDDDAYHGVEIMSNFNSHRDFIYGSFTILNGKSPYIKNQSIPSEFFLY